MSTGDFVWYELLTSNPKAAIAYYSEVVGWKTQPFEGAPEYLMWVGEQGALGGVMQLPEAAAKMGAPPHWVSNVTVADVDATVKRVLELGGKVLHGPVDMPTVGRFARIADPQGGSLSVFTPKDAMKPQDVTKPGAISWNELATTDNKAALKFYCEIFGWTAMQSMDMGPMGTYELFGKDGKQLGGIFNKREAMPVVAWGYYIEVANLDDAVGRATTHGGKLINGPMDVPGGRIAQFTDPQGAFFALHCAAKA